jgi:hypothetical protein
MEVLRTFCMVNLKGRTNATDFYRSLELLTDECGDLTVRVGSSLSWYGAWLTLLAQDRKDEFRLMAYTWCVTQQFKSAGRFMFPRGRQSTKPGGLARSCRGCPHPGINLPMNFRPDPKKP